VPPPTTLPLPAQVLVPVAVAHFRRPLGRKWVETEVRWRESPEESGLSTTGSTSVCLELTSGALVLGTGSPPSFCRLLLPSHLRKQPSSPLPLLQCLPGAPFPLPFPLKTAPAGRRGVGLGATLGITMGITTGVTMGVTRSLMHRAQAKGFGSSWGSLCR